MDIKRGTYLVAIRDVEYTTLNNKILRFTKGELYVVTSIAKITHLYGHQDIIFKVVNNYGDENRFNQEHLSHPRSKIFNIAPNYKIREKKIKEILE